MAVNSSSKRRRKPASHTLHKPRGVVHPRVQAVGPEHFAIVCIDCAKNRSKLMMADFYGQVIIEPTTVEHNQTSFDAAIRLIRDAMTRDDVKDVIIVVERTGRYHEPIWRAFKNDRLEVRVIHPFTTKHYRQPADPGNKTDDTDLSAIHRAAVNGFGLLEPEPQPVYVCLQLLARRRRDLVRKRVALEHQMLERLHCFMPGFERCFHTIFESQIAVWIAGNVGSAEAILRAGVSDLIRQLAEAGIRKHTPTIEKIVAWARTAAATEESAPLHRRFFRDLDADRRAKLREVWILEAELAEQLVLTPYVVLLSVPAIGVVSAAEFAGEAGPIEYYSTGRAVSGRAGLYPSRYQSDEVDHRDGALVRRGNRDLRNAIMMIADNLLKHNDHFRVQAAAWRLHGKDPRDIHVKVAGRFCRIAYQMVAGRQSYSHPCSKQRDYILEKLIKFSTEHEIAPDQFKRNLDAAVAQLPCEAYREEAAPLAETAAQVRKPRGAGPHCLGEILPDLLAKLGVKLVRSAESGEPDLR